ncbi:E3 ubiquitin-protein ligase [Meloidogyne graminicola]|uniref:E3 ubiquitin-protein ligase n=1 Tax=Meloidogyne graminicola TaxID=189291 RepID=A0A8S9ZYX6_9BILA|nr:E3 ubiquitin-protein ligase [Meloidogyne graminicola]
MTLPHSKKYSIKLKLVTFQQDQELGLISSRIFSQKCKRNPNSSLSRVMSEQIDIFSSIDLPEGLHISSCSHLMHFSCFNTFIKSTYARENLRRMQILNSQMLDIEMGVMPVFPSYHNLKDVFGFTIDRPFDSGTFDKWINDLTNALFTQTPVQVKGHSRKRSHSERSLAEMAKNSGVGSIISQTSPEEIGRLVGLNIGDSQSSVVSLPSSFDGSAQIENELTNRNISSTSRISISDAITGQIQSADQLDTRGAALMHIMMQHVFGGKNLFGAKKIQTKEITQENVPLSIPHWNTLKPLTKAMFIIQLTEYGTLPKINPINRVTKTYIRIFEVVNILKSCAFLLRSITSELEIENKPLFGAFNTRQRDCLNNFIRISNLIPFNCQPYGIHVLVTQLLAPLLFPNNNNIGENEQIFKNDIPSTSSKIQKLSTFSSPSNKPQTHLDQILHGDVQLMNIDMLTLAVELVICIGWCWVDGKLTNNGNCFMYKVADGSVDELYIMHLTLIGHLFQIIKYFELEIIDKQPLIESKNDELINVEIDSMPSNVKEFLVCLKQLYPKLNYLCSKNGIELYNRLHSATINFLRPLAILYNCITLVPPPESLKDPSLDGFVPLCRYLGLPSTLLEIFNGPGVEHLFRIWSQNVIEVIPHSLPLQVNQLIILPENFAELINMSANFKCPIIGEITPMVPTLCLCCGEILCSHSFCCETEIAGRKFGACAYHLTQCHGSTGIFLRIRECQIFFLYIAGESVRGCFKSAPYVDEFGETDPGFRFIKSTYARENLRRMQILNSQMLDIEMGVMPVFPSYHNLKDVFGFTIDRPFDSGTFDKWINDLTNALFTQTAVQDRTRKEANTRTQKTGPLLVKVFRSSLSGLQLLAIRLINWLSQQAQDCPFLASIISEVLLCLSSECDSVLSSPVNMKLALCLKDRYGLNVCSCKGGDSLNATLLLLFDRRLWKAARTAFHQLLMSTVLMNLEHKYIFGHL